MHRSCDAAGDGIRCVTIDRCTCASNAPAGIFECRSLWMSVFFAKLMQPTCEQQLCPTASPEQLGQVECSDMDMLADMPGWASSSL